MNAPKSELDPTEEKVTRSHDLFTDPSLSQNIKEDPVARFLAKHWKNILTAICAALVIFYMRSQILETSLARVQDSSLVYDQVRSSLGVLIDKSESLAPEEKEKLLRSLKDSLANLKSGSEPYLSLSKLYSVIAAGSNLIEVEAVDLTDWSKESNITKRLVSELSALALIRKNLDANAEDAQALLDLKKLALEARFADLSAFIALSKIALAEQDKDFLRQSSAEMISRYPEQKAKIEAALAGL